MSNQTVPGSESDKYFSVALTVVDAVDGLSPARLQVIHRPEEDHRQVVLDLSFPENQSRHGRVAVRAEYVKDLVDSLDGAVRGLGGDEVYGMNTDDDMPSGVTLQVAPSDTHPGHVVLQLTFAVSGRFLMHYRVEHVRMYPLDARKLCTALRDAVSYLRASK